MTLFFSLQKKMEVLCRVCLFDHPEEKTFQVCSCKDSASCFSCLATQRIYDERTHSYCNNLETWWTKDFKCTICKKELPPLWKIDNEKWLKFQEWMTVYDNGLDCSNEEEIRRCFASSKVQENAELKNKLTTYEMQHAQDLQDLKQSAKETKLVQKKLEKEQVAHNNTKDELRRLSKDVQEMSRAYVHSQIKIEDIQCAQKNLKRKLMELLIDEFDNSVKRIKKEEEEEVEERPFNFTFPSPELTKLFEEQETLSPVV